MSKDVTDLVEFGDIDSEFLPLTKCVCGQCFPAWEFILTIYPDMAGECSHCGRKLYFIFSTRVFEIGD